MDHAAASSRRSPPRWLLVHTLSVRSSDTGSTGASYGLTADQSRAVQTGATEAANLTTLARESYPRDFARALDGATSELRKDLIAKKAAYLSAMNAGKFDLKSSVVVPAFESQQGDEVLVLVTVDGTRVVDSVASPITTPQRSSSRWSIRAASGWRPICSRWASSEREPRRAAQAASPDQPGPRSAAPRHVRAARRPARRTRLAAPTPGVDAPASPPPPTPPPRRRPRPMRDPCWSGRTRPATEPLGAGPVAARGVLQFPAALTLLVLLGVFSHGVYSGQTGQLDRRPGGGTGAGARGGEEVLRADSYDYHDLVAKDTA